MEMTLQETGHGPATLGHIGTVEDVIAARLSPEMTARRYDARDFHAGFELATPKDLKSVGESVLINGICYANSTDRSSHDYDQTIYGEHFTAGGVFLIPKKALASHRVQVHRQMAMVDFYNRINEKIPRPLAFIGIFHFPEFHGAAVGKAPIDGRNIFEHKQEYYPNPAIRKKNVWGFVMGALTNFKGHPEVNEQMKTVLYKNPMDAESTLVHHAHILLLKKKVDRIEEVVPELVDRVLHLYIDGTTLDQGYGEIYTVKGVENYL